jgi:hypothetical protein
MYKAYVHDVLGIDLDAGMLASLITFPPPPTTATTILILILILILLPPPPPPPSPDL